jgi:hypothetical protein
VPHPATQLPDGRCGDPHLAAGPAAVDRPGPPRLPAPS